MGKQERLTVLVTGGGGFLGKAIIHALLRRGHRVHTLNRGRYEDLLQQGVICFRGDLADPRAAMMAAEGCDAVFHVAAKAGYWGRYRDYYRANVAGTQHVLSACKAHGISQLVYTSTPSVVHAGGDLNGINESWPYPKHFSAHYPATKAEAEQRVLAANGESLATVALRPHLIWGPGDNHLLPRLVARAQSGRLRLIGDGQKLIDTIYIDNAVEAHLLAWDCLRNKPSACAGKAYFISQGDPRPQAEIINSLLATQGVPPVERSLPLPVARVLGHAMELAWALLPLPGEPPLTPFLVEQLSSAHWYDISAAKNDFGFQPRISIEEGLSRLRHA